MAGTFKSDAVCSCHITNITSCEVHCTWVSCLLLAFFLLFLGKFLWKVFVDPLPKHIVFGSLGTFTLIIRFIKIYLIQNVNTLNKQMKKYTVT